MKVSVLMITYNHEKFIAQAIEGALMQRVDFDYEIVIGEDCSTDRTRDIVIGYQERYPDKIRLLLPEKNLGAKKNFIQTHKAGQGEYIALLEGDDYWTSPHKLQKQVDYLEAHPECSVCFHNVLVRHEDGSREPYLHCPPDQREISTLEDLLLRNFIPTCSTMFRNGLVTEFPDWFYMVAMGDRALHILNSQHGDVGYINEIMGVYRVHKGGVWSMQDIEVNVSEGIKLFGFVYDYLGPSYKSSVHVGVSKRLDLLIGHLIDKYTVAGSFRNLKKEVTDFFRQWPATLPWCQSEKRRVLKQICQGVVFNSWNSRNIKRVRMCYLRAVYYDPSLLRNRGFRSIGIGALLGKDVHGKLLRLSHVIMDKQRL